MSRMDGGDGAIVAQALAGDRDAFRVLVERHSHTLFRLAYRMTGNEQDAEEIVQDAFVRAYRRLDRFESRANFSTWLYRIAVNCSLDLMRKRKPEVERREQADASESDVVAQIPTAAPAPDRLLLSAELGNQVQIALGSLSPMERAAFLLRHFEGLSVEEIGRTLGLRTSATKNTVFRAVQKLRRALEPHVTRNSVSAAGAAHGARP